MNPYADKLIDADDGPRHSKTNQPGKITTSLSAWQRTVTAGNACPITDGAAAMLVSSEDFAKERELSCLGYMRDFAYAGCDPKRMGLGPVYASHKLLRKTGARKYRLCSD